MSRPAISLVESLATATDLRLSTPPPRLATTIPVVHTPSMI
jgi:hypothetical protein